MEVVEGHLRKEAVVVEVLRKMVVEVEERLESVALVVGSCACALRKHLRLSRRLEFRQEEVEEEEPVRQDRSL